MQRKKITKNIMSILLAIVFAFAPIFFVGCDLGSGEGGGSSSGGSSTGGGGGTISTNYKIGDYLDSIKVSYSVSNISSATQNEEVKEYASQIISLTQMLSADTMVGLLQQYAIDNSSAESFGIPVSSNNKELKKSVSKSATPYSNVFTVSIVEAGITFNYEYSRDSREKNTYAQDVINWKCVEGNSSITKTSNFEDYLPAIFNYDNYQHKLTYAILSIVDKFDNVSEEDFSATYKEFLNNYDLLTRNTSTDFAKLSENLALNVKHSGLYANSLESRAFKQFILDRIIGENLVKKDNQLFQVSEIYNGNRLRYKNVGENSNEKFRGETYYYNQDAEYVPDQTNDVSLYINGDSGNFPNCEQLKDKLKLIYNGNEATAEPHIAGTNVKIWQDINGDGEINFSEEIGNIIKLKLVNSHGSYQDVAFPKYRALVGFKNYDYTVEKIVERVLTDTTNKIQYKDNDGAYKDVPGKTNYPIIANVFSRNYSYTAVEVKGVSKDNSTSCKLPKLSYKSILLNMKDRTKMDVKNSIGRIYLLLESSSGTKVNVSMYARYYRKGSGFAYFGENKDLEKADDTNDTDKYTFYKFPNATGEVDGPYGIDFSTYPNIKEGCLFELEFEDLFKNAKFKTGAKTYTKNNQTFDFTYTNQDSETQTVQIYEIKPFPKDYAPIDVAGHASIYTGIDYKTKPVYDAQSIEGSSGNLYAYSDKNLAEVEGECEFIELIFVTDNNNPFTFGFTGFVPQTEL